MGFRLPSVFSTTKRVLRPCVLASKKGHVAVYVGHDENKKRHVMPVSFLNHPLFQDLLSLAEEEYGFNHPMGGLTIPCDEESFLDFISQLNCSL